MSETWQNGYCLSRPFTLRGLLVTVLTAQHPQFVLHNNGCRKCKLKYMKIELKNNTIEKPMQFRHTRDARDKIFQRRLKDILMLKWIADI